MDDAPPGTPWASIGLLVLGVVLFYAAARADTSGRPGGAPRLLVWALFVLSGGSLAAAVVAGVLG